MARRRAVNAAKKAKRLEAFLKALSEHGNVWKACEQTGCSRFLVYRARDEYENFAEAWDLAVEAAVQKLELEVRRRALKGVKEPVFHQGRVVGHVRKFSDVLAMFLLKAHRPLVYRERVDVHRTGEPGDGSVVVKIYLPSNGREVKAPAVRGRLASAEDAE